MISYLGEELDRPGCHLEFIGYYETREEAVEKLNNGLSSEHDEFGKNGGFLVERNPGIACIQLNNRQFFKLEDMIYCESTICIYRNDILSLFC